MLDESLELISGENESMLSSERTIIVNHRNDDEFSVTGYKQNNVFTGLFYILGFLSLGFVFLLSYWYPHKRLKFSHDICYLGNATSLLIVHSNGGQCSVRKIKSIKVNSGGIDDQDLVIYEKSLLRQTPVYYFEHMFLRYYFNDQFTDIHEVSGLDNLFTSSDFEKMKDGLSSEASQLKATIHNFNFIDVPLKSYAIVCIELAANPFYCFQLFSVILWYTDEYQYYASVILFLTVISLAITTYETRKHMKKLHDMVGESTTVSVLRKSHEITKLDSKLLVPGDVFIIPHSGLDVPCDAVLITGRCIVNESSLTGESFPVTKTAVDRLVGTDGAAPTVFSLSKSKQHALYNGTKILEAHCLQTDPRSQQVMALVIRTGFTTLKGRLVRSIIHPKPVHFKFFRDSMKFILTFGFIAFLGFIYSLVTFVNHGEDAGYVIRRSLDLFTIAIPPALPACMSIGIMHAMRDLKKYHIYSIDPDRINLCAKIKLFVFDKTGTLTEDRLTVNGVIANDEKELSQLKTEVDLMKDDAEILKAMASCHSLSILNHEIIGDPLDLSMFEFTKWQLNDQASDQSCITVFPTRGKQTIEILKKYMFDSSLQRMSVIAKEIEDVSLKVYAKGSPEMLLSLCNKNTIPIDAKEVLDNYTTEGARVLAIARKVLRKELTVESDLREMFPRNEVEKDLDFLGFIVFQNVVKPGSKATINTLQKANIRCVMATGDNLKTAAAVARQVNIIKEIQSTVKIKVENGTVKFNVLTKSGKYSAAGDTVLKIDEPARIFNQELYTRGLPYGIVLTGNTYKKLKALNQPKVLENVLLSTSVFARMSPEDKVTLIEDLKALDYGVGMCGDGANDCGALKAAHAGIALSDTEASVAAPFTSKIFDISCVPKLISEGRAALVTAFDTFKYMVLYSFIQFSGVIILYSIKSNYSNFEFLYADLFLSFPLVIAMIQSKANPELVAKRPNGRLVHPIFIFNILLQILLMFSFQLCVFFYVRTMPWFRDVSYFKDMNTDTSLNYYSYENVTVMIIAFFQYIWGAIVFMSGTPYREPIYKNYYFIGTFLITLVLTLYITIHPAEFVRKILLFVELPSYPFIFSLLGICAANLFLSFIINSYLMPSRFVKDVSNKIRRKRQPKNKYKHAFINLANDRSWEPLR